jgi:excisionase family DNA binding protein
MNDEKKNMNAGSNLLAPKDVAQRLKVSTDKVGKLIASGQLKAINLAKPGAIRQTYRIRESDLDLLFNENVAGNLVAQPLY